MAKYAEKRDTMTKKELAIAKRNGKYNCAQAVACSFSKEIGVDETVLFKACEGFGSGMGCMECTCGALSGAILLAGFKNSDGHLENPATKTDTYRYTRQMVETFKAKAGSTVCGELKGIGTGHMLRSCPDCIMDSVEIVQEVLGI